MAEMIPATVTGSVWRVLVKAGKVVAVGEEIVIVESMKMEIPVESPRSGTITKVLVVEGDSVEEGDPVAEFD